VKEITRHANGSTSWACECGAEVTRYRGQSDVDCLECGACYNASGQRLRDDWRDTLLYDDGECGDMEAFERAAVARENQRGAW
jgi:hypothetical protein